MSEIYHWFLTSGQSPVSSFGRWYISEHAQKPRYSVAFSNMPPVYDWWFLTYKDVNKKKEGTDIQH